MHFSESFILTRGTHYKGDAPVLRMNIDMNYWPDKWLDYQIIFVFADASVILQTRRAITIVCETEVY